jgi:ubiquinone/menaquinone biosynthesis C-methylase UbiE
MGVIVSPFQGPDGNSFDKFDATGVEGWMVDRFNRHALETVGKIPVERVLDVGCGEGRMIHDLVVETPGLRVTGIDDDTPKLKEGWRRNAHPRIRFEVADVYKLPFPDSHFDLVTAFSVLEHLEDPHAALMEIRRVCSPGWLIASVPFEPWWRAGNVAMGRYRDERGNTPGHVQHWSRHGFRRLMEEHGRIDSFRGSTVWSLACLLLAPPNARAGS